MQNTQGAAASAQATTVAQAQGTNVPTPSVAPEAPLAPPPLPPGGGRLIIDDLGDRKVLTMTELPPSVMPLVSTVKDTAIGLGVLLAIIVIVGPFARMLARRMEKAPELRAAANHSAALQQQIEQLQQSVDAMSIEVERISESQRFQSKLLVERKPASSFPS